MQKDDLHEAQQHSHAPNPAAVDADKLKVTMKAKIQTTKTRPGQVLASAVLSAAPETRAALGRPDNIKRNLRRQKRSVLPPEPATLKDFVVRDEWAGTGGPAPQDFLMYDSGSDHSDRVVISASSEQLRHLAVADTWFMDDTFSVAPKFFTQLYVIRVPLGDSAVTCVYALMTG